MKLTDIFCKTKNTRPRDKFLSKLFGIFSEEIVSIWCKCEETPYSNIGRPTLMVSEKKEKGKQIDFTLKNKKGDLYVAECKCLLEYSNFKYLTLEDSKQFQPHLKKPAFNYFLNISRHPKDYDVKLKNNTESIKVKGGILIWGSIDERKKTIIQQEYNFEDILSVENMITHLINSENQDYKDLIKNIKGWTNDFCDSIVYTSQ